MQLNLRSVPRLCCAGSIAHDNYPIGGTHATIVGYTRDRKGRIQNYHLKEIANTLHTGGGNTSQYLMITDMEQQDNYRVRRFTERECFRLMGVGESDIDKIQAAGISPTRQKSLAGNSIVVDVLTEIFRTMLDSDSPEYDKPQQLTLF